MRAPLVPFIALLILSIPASPGEPQPAGAQPAGGAADLVSAMRVQAIFEGATRHAYLHDERAQTLPAAVRDCLAKIDLSFAHGMYVQVVEEVLTPTEIAEAIRYFQSRAGYLDVMLAVRKHRASLEAPDLIREADAAGEPTAEESRLMESFERSPLAEKIGQIHTEARKERLSDIAAEKMLVQCRPQP